MGISSKAKSENWGMGFLLVFFPEDQLPSLPTVNSLRRSSSNHYILTKTQSAISICAFLFLVSLLLFLLEPIPSSHLTPTKTEFAILPSNFALQKMGILHRKGTKGMHDLIVGHVTESVSPEDLKMFLRLFHFSNFSSKSDLVLIFPFRLEHLENMVSQEIEAFSRMNSTKFVKLSSKDVEPIWGKKSRIGNLTVTEFTRSSNKSTEMTRQSYGSVVSFVADELDPENSLSGFLDYVAMGMSRWACYPMLLGRVRRNFKHIILVDVREVFFFGDPLGPVRTRSPEWVQFTADSTLAHHKHGKKGNYELVAQKRVYSGLVLGGSRGVRRLANAMLTEIVRATTTTKKKKNLVTEAAILNQLATNDHVLKSNNVNAFSEPVPDVSSLGQINSGSGLGKFTAVRRGNGNNVDVNSVIRKHICSSLQVNSSIYSDC